jgi:hypothetical protein
MSVTIYSYLDGSLTDGFQFYNRNAIFGTVLDYGVTGDDGTGTLIPAAPLTYCQNPNATPDVQTLYPGLYGIDPTEGDEFSVLPWVGVPYDGLATRWRFFFGTLQVNPRWKVGGTTVNLSDRWVGGGYYAWTGYDIGRGQEVNRQEWSHGSAVGAKDYTLSDDSGLATYIGLFGIALFFPNDGSGHFNVWKLYGPADAAGALTVSGRGGYDLSFVLRQNELARTSIYYDGAAATAGGAFVPTMQPYDGVHTIRQRNAGEDADAGFGLSVDYGAAWDAASGMLDLSGITSPVAFDYEQTGRVTVRDGAQNPISGRTCPSEPVRRAVLTRARRTEAAWRRSRPFRVGRG